MDLPKNIGLRINDAAKQMLYYNSSGNVEIISFLDNDTIAERATFNYNSKSKLLNERYFSYGKNRYVTQTKYVYDRSNELTEKIEDDLENGLTKRGEYQQGRLIREEYIYNGQLDHAITYIYKFN